MPYGLNHENHYCSRCGNYGCGCGELAHDKGPINGPPVYYAYCPTCGNFRPERVEDGKILPCAECRITDIERRLEELERRK